MDFFHKELNKMVLFILLLFWVWLTSVFGNVWVAFYPVFKEIDDTAWRFKMQKSSSDIPEQILKGGGRILQHPNQVSNAYFYELLGG